MKIKLITTVLFFSIFTYSQTEVSTLISNTTGERIKISISYKSNAGWITKGWFSIENRETIKVELDENTDTYFVYAKSDKYEFYGNKQKSFYVIKDKNFIIQNNTNIKNAILKEFDKVEIINKEGFFHTIAHDTYGKSLKD